ncbi:MAG: efflux RND transporter periplasmic adaptor subunit [Myxococcales bacterium]
MRPRIGLAVSAALLALLQGACSNSRRDLGSAKAPPADAGTMGAAKAQVKLCEHQVPAELCTRCNPDLAQTFKEMGDWCQEHGLPESQCRKCNPALTFEPVVPKDWCKEHAVPESMCTKCKPSLVAKFVAAGDYCREHGFPDSVCPYCHPELVKAAGAEPPVFPEPGTTVRLASPETAREAGLQAVPVAKQRVAPTLEVVGQLDFNQNALAELTARGEALVLGLRVDLGDEVKRGQPLLTLASAAVGSNQAQLAAAEARVQAARAALQRMEALVAEGIGLRKDLEQARTELAAAQAEHSAARSALGAAGAAATGTDGTYVLTAPIAGTVVARDAVVGRTAGPETVLVRIADLSTLWAHLEIPEARAGEVRVGQRVVLALDAGAGALEGTIARVGAAVDPRTRTVSARVVVSNPARSLKAGAFLRARIAVAVEHEAIVIPAAAVQRAQASAFVFVRRDASTYVPVPVKTAQEADGRVEVVEGLAPGDEVVTTGAFLLKTEILKESIGAGCCDEGGGQ